MLLRNICVLLLTVTAEFSQAGWPAMHSISASQGRLRIVLRDAPSDSQLNWTLDATVNSTPRAEVEKLLVTKTASLAKVTSDRQVWQNLRFADGVVEVNGLDALKEYTLNIWIEVPAHTEVSVEKGSSLLFTGSVEGILRVRNGVEQPVLVSDSN